MSGKAKSNKSSWSQCRLCHSLIPTNESSPHLKIYHGGETDEQATPKSSSNSKEYDHGYIRENILHGCVKELPNKGVESDKLPLSHIDEFVLLHPNTMSMCQIFIDSWVVLWRSDASNKVCMVFLKAWPFISIGNMTNVVISRQIRELLSCELNDVIHVRRFQCSEHIPASEVEMVPKEDRVFYDNPDFLKYFSRACDGKLITLEAALYINYLGQNCFLTVTNIECDGINVMDAQNINTNNTLNQSEICHNMEMLKLDTYVQQESKTANKTPKKGTPSHQMCFCEKMHPKLNGNSYYIHSKTKFRIKSSYQESETIKIAADTVSFEDIGGLNKQIGEIQQMLNLPAEDNKTFLKFGLIPPKGILLFGPSGTGKTLIARAIRDTADHSFITINGPELFSRYYGETESKLRAIFEDAKQRAPSIIFIDNIDCLCPKRTGSGSRQEHRVLSTLLSLMDKIPSNPNENVVILAATNNLDALDPAIRRPGRLDREIEIGIPTESGRREILTKLLKRANHSLSNDDIINISQHLHGYVGADIAAVCAQAGFCSLKRQLHDTTDEVNITYQDIATASKLVKPSAMREILIEVPTVRWSDVGGQDDLKQKLKQAVEWPLKYPAVFERMGITPPKGILMYGPPGCSKTLIAKALATESGLNFIAIKGPELFNKWVGESERAVREVFRKARSVAPSIVFFDEIDALAANRGGSSGGSNVGDRVLAQVLTEIDGLQQLKGVTIVAATNRPDLIDKALLRPGRLDRIVYVSLPDAKTRGEIFRIQFERIPVNEDVCIEYLTSKTEGYSGAEVVAVCREAALKAMEESFDATQVKAIHFEFALKTVKARTSKDMIKFYEDYCLKSGPGGEVHAMNVDLNF